jgi:predicted O-methyltransferase YrrM
MPIHSLVRQIHATGRTLYPDGSERPTDSFIPADECELIYRMVEASRAVSAVETGMAFGASSLCIADALSANAGRLGRPARLISIDPAQTSSYGGAGLHLLRRACLDSFVEVIEQPSQLALPGLATSGHRIEFGFIDGWHTFDHTLIDFFYVDWMLEPDGIIVFDDVGYPAIHAVVRFVLANRDYELVEALAHAPPPRSIRIRRVLKRWLRPIGRTDRYPSKGHERLFRSIEDCHSVAVRKRGHDTRRFDHFERF